MQGKESPSHTPIDLSAESQLLPLANSGKLSLPIEYHAIAAFALGLVQGSIGRGHHVGGVER